MSDNDRETSPKNDPAGDDWRDRAREAAGDGLDAARDRFEAARERVQDRLGRVVDEADVFGNARQVAEGFWPKLRSVVARIPFAEDVLAAWFCAMDSETPLRVRGTLFAALAYFVIPLDLVPDILLLVGFADDLTVILTTVTLLSTHIKPRHREAARRVLDGEQAMDETGAEKAAAEEGIVIDHEAVPPAKP